MIGQITPLGFGKYQINIDDESLHSKFGQICEPATKSEILSIRGNDGVRFLCTPDGTTLRKPPAPIALDFKPPEKTKCFDPERGIVFLLDPDAPKISFGSCGGNSYAIREVDFQRISDALNNVVELPDVELGPFDTEVATYSRLEAEKKIEAETTGRLPAPEAIRDQGWGFNVHGTLNLRADFYSQSITAGITGELAAIEVLYEYAVEPIKFSIYAGGNPVTGAPLYTEVIETPVFKAGGGVFRWLLPSNTLFFEKGEQFTFVFHAPSSRVILGAEEFVDYIGGELFQNGVPSPGADDVAFITYVVPATSPSNKAFNEMSLLREAAEQGDAYSQSKLGYIALKMRFNGSNNGMIFLSQRDAKEALNISRETVASYFAELEAKGFILKTEGHCLGPDGRGRAAKWALTEEALNAAPATKDFVKWKK